MLAQVQITEERGCGGRSRVGAPATHISRPVRVGNQSGRRAPPFPVRLSWRRPTRLSLPRFFRSQSRQVAHSVPFRPNLSWRRSVSPSGPACIGGACAAVAGRSAARWLCASYIRLAVAAPEIRERPRVRFSPSHRPGAGRELPTRCGAVGGQVGLRGCGLLGAGTGTLTPTAAVPPSVLRGRSGSSPDAGARAEPREGGHRKSGTSRPGAAIGSAWGTQTRPPSSWHKPWVQAGLEC